MTRLILADLFTAEPDTYVVADGDGVSVAIVSRTAADDTTVCLVRFGADAVPIAALLNVILAHGGTVPGAPAPKKRGVPGPQRSTASRTATCEACGLAVERSGISKHRRRCAAYQASNGNAPTTPRTGQYGTGEVSLVPEAEIDAIAPQEPAHAATEDVPFQQDVHASLHATSLTVETPAVLPPIRPAERHRCEACHGFVGSAVELERHIQAQHPYLHGQLIEAELRAVREEVSV